MKKHVSIYPEMYLAAILTFKKRRPLNYISFIHNCISLSISQMLGAQ